MRRSRPYNLSRDGDDRHAGGGGGGGGGIGTKQRAPSQVPVDAETQLRGLITEKGLADEFEAFGWVGSLGALLALARESRGLSQDESSKRGDVSQAHISRLENGLAVKGPTIETLARYLRGLGFDLELQLKESDSGEVFGQVTKTGVSTTTRMVVQESSELVEAHPATRGDSA